VLRRRGRCGLGTLPCGTPPDGTPPDLGGGKAPQARHPGLAVTVEMKTGARRIISDVLSPLARYKQQALRER